MSAVIYNSLYAMVTRGSADLAMIESAEKKKQLTAAEAEKLRAYWHQLNDPRIIVNLNATVSAEGAVTVTWSSPSRNQIVLGYTGTDGDVSEEVPASTFGAVLASAPSTGTTLEISARHLTTAGTGEVASVTATYPAPPTPEPTSEGEGTAPVPTDGQNASASTGDAGADTQEP